MQTIVMPVADPQAKPLEIQDSPEVEKIKRIKLTYNLNAVSYDKRVLQWEGSFNGMWVDEELY